MSPVSNKSRPNTSAKTQRTEITSPTQQIVFSPVSIKNSTNESIHSASSFIADNTLTPKSTKINSADKPPIAVSINRIKRLSLTSAESNKSAQSK